VLNKVAIRTLQSYFPWLKPAKDEFYFRYRLIMRSPSQHHFKFLKVFGHHLSGTYVDIGGNIGQSVQAIRMFVPEAKIISFEPNPNLAKFIGNHFRKDKIVIVRNLGLGSESGHFKLYIPTYRGFIYDALASLDKNRAEGWLNDKTLYCFNRENLAIIEMNCEISTLDKQHIDDVVFIKIDVEGFEDEVIKGGIETIRRDQPVMMIEDFHNSTYMKNILYQMSYRPFDFDGKILRRGESETSTFLITPRRMAELSIDG